MRRNISGLSGVGLEKSSKCFALTCLDVMDVRLYMPVSVFSPIQAVLVSQPVICKVTESCTSPLGSNPDSYEFAHTWSRYTYTIKCSCHHVTHSASCRCRKLITGVVVAMSILLQQVFFTTFVNYVIINERHAINLKIKIYFWLHVMSWNVRKEGSCQPQNGGVAL